MNAVGRMFGASAADLAGETRRRQFATLLEHSPDATVVLDADGHVCEWNPAAERLLGHPRQRVVGVQARTLVPSSHRERFDSIWALLLTGNAAPPPETYQVLRDRSAVAVSLHIAPILADGRIAGAVAILRADPGAGDGAAAGRARSGEHAAADDAEPTGGVGFQVDEGTRSLSVLERDELTGLPGRRRIQRRLTMPVPTGLTRGIAVLDVDAFALVNEAYGPDVGDEVLSSLARRLISMPGAADLGRWQADAFVWVVDAEDPAAVLRDICAAVTAALDDPFHLGGEDLRLTASTGLVTSARAPADGLLTAAMDALRAAKDTGRDRAVWYTPELRSSSYGGFRLANDLHHGIERGELRLHFQPIVQLATGHVVGVEALVRWERPGVGLLSPLSFINVAERTGQIVPLGRWVAQEACRVAAHLAPLADRPRSVSVNVSARQLSDPGLVEMLRDALEESGCPPAAIIIEVTETALMHDLGASAATLDAIKALGVGLDLDDFGTGYSSLMHLKHFPVDRIKIDQTFVAGLGTDAADTAIVASTIALAHSVGIQAVAEGVETPGQLALLRQMGCDFVQGYLISRPLRPDLVDDWLVQHSSATSESRGARTGNGPWAPRRGDSPADRRRVVADRRDGVADRRDEVADGRDQSGDERDEAGDVRDGLADVRDELADERDDVAAVRDRAADDRDSENSASSSLGATGASGLPAIARRDAESRRDRASVERVMVAGDRAQAERDRDVASAGRESGASEREQAESDRAVADAGRHPDLPGSA